MCRWASHSPLPSLLLTRGCMGLDHWIMCCSGHPGWSLMSWLSVPTVPTRWRINIVIVSPLAGSRHSVFRVKDGCCSWSPYISLTLRYSTNRAVKEIARKFHNIWRGFLIWLFRNLLGHNLKHAFKHISTISLTPLSTTHSGKDKNKMRCNLPLLLGGRPGRIFPAEENPD